MRSFDSFVARRRIKDAKAWFATIGVRSQEQFLAWCERESVKPPEEDIFASIQEPPPVIKPKSRSIPKTPKSANATAKKSTSRKETRKKDATWVPAAERSRVVKGKKPSSTPPARKVNEEDEEHSKHAEASDS